MASAAAHRRQRGSLSFAVTASVAAVAGATLLVTVVLVLTGLTGHSLKPSATHDTGAVTPTSGHATTAVQPDPSTAPGHPVHPATRRWLVVLRSIDDRRRQAWRLGRPELLDRVYLPGSSILRTDKEMLLSYVRRGLRVSGVTLQFHSVVVESRRPQAVRLEVVDRLRRAVAIRGEVAHVLPKDRPTRHRIDLRRVDGSWLIARVEVI